MAQHEAWDQWIVAVIVLFAVAEWRWLWPGFLRRIASGAPGARRKRYQKVIVSEWLFALAVLAYWLARARPGSSLLLGRPPALNLAIGLTLAVLVMGFLWIQRRRLLANPAAMRKLAGRLDFGGPLLPHVHSEHRLFVLVSLSAGVCEEVIFRGFLLWYFSVWTEPWLALLISSAVFGLAHIYLGLAQVPRTGLVGFLLGALALLSGSLLPAMMLHAVLDMHSGTLAYRVFSVPPIPQAAVAES